METPEHKDLEQFIDAQLRKLPEREAPEALLVNVMAAIAAREALPWWRQPFTEWPRHNRAILFMTLASVFVMAAYLLGRPAESITLSQIVKHLSSFAWVGRLLQALGESVVLVVQNMPLNMLLALGLLLVSLYAACIAAGAALYRVTAGGGSRSV